MYKRQVHHNLRVKKKTPLKEIPEFNDAIAALDQKLNGKGRSVVRYSGTEPLLRLMIEGESADQLQAELDVLVDLAEQKLGKAS